MVTDGVGDGVALALRTGVIAAHDALQFREFTDHACNEVGLAQSRSAFSVIGACALDDPLFNQPARQICDAINLVGDTAQFFVEGNLRQLLGLIVKRDFQILFPEELRVRQTRGQHLLITRNNRCAIVMRVDIRSADKGVG